MKASNCIVLLLLLIGTMAQAQNPKELVQKSDELLKGTSTEMELKMTVVRPSWTRETTLKSWGKGEEYSLILITGPARDKGTAFLKRGREMWNWQPSIDRVVKMPPSMLTQSWMGSDFTNDDLVRQTSMVHDFDHRLLGSEVIEGRNCHIVELIPHEDAAVTWGRIVIWIDQKDFLQLKVEFYDEDEYLVNIMHGKAIKTMGGRTLPTILELVPADKPGEKTVIEYVSARFDVPISDDFFSVQNMKRIR